MSRRRKNNAKKKLNLRWLLLWVILGAGAFAFFLSLPLFEIRDVAVNGTKMLSSEDIKAISGIPLSENLFYTGFSKAKTNLSKISAIKEFKIYRIPPGTVLINIVERKPVAVLVFPSRSIFIDAQGFVLNPETNIELNVPEISDLPVITGIDENAAFKGSRIDPVVAEVIADIVLKLSPYLSLKSLRLELGGLEEIQFMLDDILRVKVGSSQNIKKKMRVFQAFLPKISGKWTQVDYVDVRFPDFPVIKFK